MKRSKILGAAGSDNYRVEHMPVHLPKENMKFFYFMQDQANEEPFDNYRQYGNAYHNDWQEHPSKQDNTYLKIMEAINTGIDKALNEETKIPNQKLIRKEFIEAFTDKYPQYIENKDIIIRGYSNIINLYNEFDENVSFYLKYNGISDDIFHNTNFTFKKTEIPMIKQCDYVICFGTKRADVYILRADWFELLLNSVEVHNFRIEKGYDKLLDDDMYLIPQSIIKSQIIKFGEFDKMDFSKGTMFTAKKLGRTFINESYDNDENEIDTDLPEISDKFGPTMADTYNNKKIMIELFIKKYMENNPNEYIRYQESKGHVLFIDIADNEDFNNYKRYLVQINLNIEPNANITVGKKYITSEYIAKTNIEGIIFMHVRPNGIKTALLLDNLSIYKLYYQKFNSPHQFVKCYYMWNHIKRTTKKATNEVKNAQYSMFAILYYDLVKKVAVYRGLYYEF